MYFGSQNRPKINRKIDYIFDVILKAFGHPKYLQNATRNRLKINVFFNDFWKGFWKDFRSQMASIFEAYGLHFGSIFRSGVFVKIRTFSSESTKIKDREGQRSSQNRFKNASKKLSKNNCFIDFCLFFAGILV